MKNLTIAIDFDGTCVTHEFPKVGRDIGAEIVLKELVEKGHKLILFTMRSDIEHPISQDGQIVAEPGDYLTEAINWFNKKRIPLYGIQENPTQKTWSTSPKCYANLYIDDSALGIPLTNHCFVWGNMVQTNDRSFDRPFVDWEKVREMLIERNIL